MRKIIFLLLIALSSWLTAFPQYWQQQVNYSIDVSLNDKEHTLDGFERIEYINNSPDTLRFIWFHLWPNAYKNDKTAFSDQLLENGNTKFYFSDKGNRGYINRLDFKVDNITADIEDHPQHIDIVKVILPSPLAPGHKINITTPFHVKLPFNFSRSGHDGQSYQLTQWYPKPAVYDHKGWHPMPYLDQGEYYSEFGNFDVNITVPKNYVVAATGELQNKDEIDWLKSRSSFSWEPLKEKVKSKTGQIQTITQQFPASSNEIKRLQFKQTNVHDFAWFADKRFIVKSDTCKLPSGKIIDVYSYFTNEQKEHWKNSLQFTKDAAITRSEWVGEYPYNIISVVQGPQSFGGGMEYPTITIISPIGNERELENLIGHEVSHNWFYGILGSNERLHPWMDEGLNSYYDIRQTSWKYGISKKDDLTNEKLERILLETLVFGKIDQPINEKSEQYNAVNYGLVAYYKTGEWFKLLEKKLGKEVFDKAIQEYYNQWKFKHPYPEDLKKIIESVSGQDLSNEFSLLDEKGMLPGNERKGWKTVSPLRPKTFADYIIKPSKDWLMLSPLLGLNSYDKLMIGAAISNYKLPPSPFQFLFTPMYSTGAKKLNGLGKLNYTFFPNNGFRKIDLFANASIFSNDEFLKQNGEKAIAGFQKIVTGARFTMNEKDPRSTRTRYVQWKSFFINEGSFRISYDTLISGIDTSINQMVSTRKDNRTLQQYKFVIANNRALYPYSAE